MKKNQRGITLIALAITIVVLAILTFNIIVKIKPYGNETVRVKFESTMQSLREETEQYYNRNNELPVLEQYTNQVGLSLIENIKNVNDNNVYYILDTSKLDVKIDKDVFGEIYTFIVNEDSHTIYFPLGIVYDDERHYTEFNTYTEIDI